MLNIVLMGPPGAGKGTHALWIAKDYGLPHISTGDMFREAMSSGSELGNKIKTIVNSGGLVSDDLTCALVKERLSRKDCEASHAQSRKPRPSKRLGKRSTARSIPSSTSLVQMSFS